METAQIQVDSRLREMPGLRRLHDDQHRPAVCCYERDTPAMAADAEKSARILENIVCITDGPGELGRLGRKISVFETLRTRLGRMLFARPTEGIGIGLLMQEETSDARTWRTDGGFRLERPKQRSAVTKPTPQKAAPRRT